MLLKLMSLPPTREALGEDPDAKKAEEEEQSRSHKQIEESRQVRSRLCGQGNGVDKSIKDHCSMYMWLCSPVNIA